MVLHPCTDDLGESTEKVNARSGELVTADEPTVVSKSSLDAIVVENGQGDGCFPNPPCSDESDWREVFCEINDLLDQFVASETGPRWRGWGFARCAEFKRDVLNPYQWLRSLIRFEVCHSLLGGRQCLEYSP